MNKQIKFYIKMQIIICCHLQIVNNTNYRTEIHNIITVGFFGYLLLGSRSKDNTKLFF